MHHIRALVIALFIAGACSFATQRRDPLTEAEIDQLREAAQDAPTRLKLYINFTQARFVALDRLKAQPNPGTNHGRQMHDALEDVSTLTDELNDNIDTYSKQPDQDLRKPLNELLGVIGGWQTSLQLIKDAAATDPRAKQESRDYYFILDSAIESARSLLENARETLTEQITAHARKKKK